MSKQATKGQTRRSVANDPRASNPISDKATKRVIAPYVMIVRKGVKRVESEEAKQFAVHVQKKPSVLIRDLSSFLSDSVDLGSLLHETADVLQIITKATGVNLYMMDSITHELYVSRKTPVDERYKIRWKIEEKSTVASYVAYKKEYVLVDDIIRDERFPEGIGYEGDAIKSVLCVPVVTPDGACFAVIELYRLVFDKPFGKDDLKIAIVLTVWMGAAIHQNSQRLALKRQQELNDYLLDLINCYIGETVVVHKLIQEIVKFAKITLAAERGSFFVIDKESDELVADLFDDFGEGDVNQFKKTKIRFGKERGIASTVARTGVTVNIKDAYNDIRFNQEIDQKSGFITRSILCMPIMGLGEISGVMQVVNKKNGGFFTQTDEILFRTFSTYSALALHFTNVKREVNCNKRLNNVILKLLQLQKVPCTHDLDDLKRYPSVKIPSPFHEFSWYVNPEDYSKLPHFCMYIMTHIMDGSKLDLDNVMSFILTVRKLCKKNPYHNFEHTFSVFHCMYLILIRNLKKFTHIEIKALLIASFCYDVDHPGVTSDFLHLSKDDLSYLYENSTLQNYCYYVTTLILQDCKLFLDLSEEEEIQLDQEIRQAILSNNSLTRFRNIVKLKELCQNNSFDWQNDLHRSYLKGIMMTSCDFSGLCKPFLISKRNIDNLYAEYYRQGDIERKMGICLLSLMDRQKQNVVPEDQVTFISNAVLPNIDLLCFCLPNTIDLLNDASLLRKIWQDIISVRGKKCWRQDDAIVQKLYE